MKQIILLLGLVPSLYSIAQIIPYDQQNLEKYWKFRNTFKEQFIKIGPNQGESLPAGSISPCACVDDLFPSEDGTEWGVTPNRYSVRQIKIYQQKVVRHNTNITCYGEMNWGDGMIRHGHYLGLLATEYRLLKNSGEDVIQFIPNTNIV